jgi:hypothetical protein
MVEVLLNKESDYKMGYLTLTFTEAGRLKLAAAAETGTVQTYLPVYNQAAAPNIPNDSQAIWVDASKRFYLVVDVGGIQKKVELT